MKLRSNDVELYYEVHADAAGEGAPWVVFSHSLACSTAMWKPQIEYFAQRYRVLAFDTRGHGQSGAPAGPYTLGQLADDLHGLLRGAGIDAAHFVGLSMGGMIGQVFALEYPGIFKSLTIADSTSRWPPEAAAMFAGRVKIAEEQGMEALVASTLARWFTAPFCAANPAAVAGIAAQIRATPVAGYAGCSDAIPRIDTTARLKEIACPILVMVGADDPGTPLAMSQAIHANAPGSELVVLERAAHLSNVEQALAFNEALAAFLERCDSSGHSARRAL